MTNEKFEMDEYVPHIYFDAITGFVDPAKGKIYLIRLDPKPKFIGNGDVEWEDVEHKIVAVLETSSLTFERVAGWFQQALEEAEERHNLEEDEAKPEKMFG